MKSYPSCVLEIINHISLLVQLYFRELFTKNYTKLASFLNSLVFGFSCLFIPK